MTRVLIQAVPWEMGRVRNVKELRRQVPDAEIVWDQTHNAMDTWLSVMRTIGDDPAVVIEDDVRLAPRWRVRVEAAILDHPEHVIQFFSLRAADHIGHWAKGRTFLMNQCYYLPARMAAALVQHAEQWREEKPKSTGYDLLMADYLRKHGLDYWQHAPTLVQHETWQSMINPRRPRNRTSPHFEEGSS